MSQHATSQKGASEHNSAKIRHLKPVKSPEKAGKSGQITPKQEEFVQWYFTKNYIVDAAEAMDISERTARRYLKLPAVIARLEEVRQDRREAMREQLNTCMEYAVEIIKEKLRHGAYPDDRYQDPDDVFRYVALLLKHSADHTELDALKLRIAALEAELKNAAGSVVEATVESDTNPTL